VLVFAITRVGHKRPTPRPAVAVQAAPGRSRQLPPALLGFNGEAVTGPGNVWSDPRFVGAVAALRPQALRVFGGTTANYWDWRAGGFVRSRSLPGSLRAARAHVHVTLADWARVVQAAHATPVFDLNLYTSTLGSQLAMLGAAEKLGMPITYVELGNELYLPAYANRFRDGGTYGRLATRWAAAVKRQFPRAKVAAVAFAGPDSNTNKIDAREVGWNPGLLGTLRGVDALTFHAYFTSGLAADASLSSPVAAEAMLSAPARRWAPLSVLIARLPPGTDAWVTEWNLFDRGAPVHGTWAQGLGVAAFGLDLVTAPRVEQADYHSLVSSAPFGALFGDGDGLALGPGHGSVLFQRVSSQPPRTPRFGLSGGGVAMQALLGALSGARSARPLSFTSADPRFASSGVGLVRGAMFAGASNAGAVVANLSAHPVALALPPVLSRLPYRQRWAPPGTLVTGVGSLRLREGKTSASLMLEAFSLTRVGAGS
jgi:hypothetical protein